MVSQIDDEWRGALQYVGEGPKSQRQVLDQNFITYYKSEVFRLMLPIVTGNFREEVRFFLASRLEDEHRFRSSEFLYWAFRDLCHAELALNEESVQGDLAFQNWCTKRESVIPLCLAVVEMAQMSRLLKDDFVDHHTSRWNQPALRQRVGDSKAILAADLLGHIAFLLATDCDEALTRLFPESWQIERSVSKATAQYFRRVSTAMIWELDFKDGAGKARNGGVAQAEYANVLGAKHSTGVLSVGILNAVAYASERGRELLGSTKSQGPRLESLLAAARAYDFVGGVFNDWSEVSNYRGSRSQADRVRQNRGKKNEVQLDRPTLVHRYIQSQDYIQNCPDAVEKSLSRQIDYLLSEPQESGLSAFAREQVKDAYEGMLGNLEGFERMRQWLGLVRDERLTAFGEEKVKPNLDPLLNAAESSA